MSKFKEGDRFYSIGSGQKGTILNSYYSASGILKYLVTFDSFPNASNEFQAFQVDSEWAFLPESLPAGNENFHTHRSKTYIGLRESYEYCEICGVKL